MLLVKCENLISEREVDFSLPPSAEIRNACSYTFMTLYLVKPLHGFIAVHY